MPQRVQGLERRLMPIGKIRFGDQIEASNGKLRPHVLDKPRLTSSNSFLLHEAAKLYGGTVRMWEGAPAGLRQWELYVEVDAIPILIPPIDALMQCYEVWSAKGCLRRCDNQTIQYAFDQAEVGQPCSCPVDPGARMALATEGKACKLTTRIACMLPDLPGIGIWTIETHSYYASLWTAGMVEMLEAMAKAGRVCEAMLRIERQTRKGRNGVRNFAIPVIIPQQMTPRQLFATEMRAALGQPAVDESLKTIPEHTEDLYGRQPEPKRLEATREEKHSPVEPETTVDKPKAATKRASKFAANPETEVLRKQIDALLVLQGMSPQDIAIWKGKKTGELQQRYELLPVAVLEGIYAAVDESMRAPVPETVEGEAVAEEDGEPTDWRTTVYEMAESLLRLLVNHADPEVITDVSALCTHAQALCEDADSTDAQLSGMVDALDEAGYRVAGQLGMRF